MFRISRSALTELETVIVEIFEGGYAGRGECRPYPRYGETVESVIEEINAVVPLIENGLTLEGLQSALPAGAARNALDCALWDLKAKITGKTVSKMLGLPLPKPRTTAYTLSWDSAEKMAEAAAEASIYPLLKIKIGQENSLQTILAILKARPNADLIVDANEALSFNDSVDLQKNLAGTRVVLIEQPTAEKDTSIRFNPSQTPMICADEAIHGDIDLDALWDSGYRAVNIKLDKCGGLTGAHNVMLDAKKKGFTVMAGCMAASSLAMAPMQILESLADYIDLDGPLLLAKDIDNGIIYDGPVMLSADQRLWG